METEVHFISLPGCWEVESIQNWGDKMDEKSGCGPAYSEYSITEGAISERRLWMAVLVTAVEDWRRGTLRAKRAAQQFLFEDDRDFMEVCAGAGIDPSSFRFKLTKIGRQIEMTGPWSSPLAA